VKSPHYLPLLLALSLSLVLPLCASDAANAARADGAAPQSSGGPPASASVIVPGPLRSFLRMAGISQRVPPEEVLPLLARNVFSQGYVGSNRPTEFLILLSRYVQQARELSSLAGPDGKIQVTNCEDAGPLLHVLGYRPREDCGQSTASLETADPERAFLTIDSGFPLPQLEQTLQGRGPFAYPYPGTSLSVFLTANDWTSAGKKENPENKDLIDTLLRDPAVARLYWSFSHLDPETSDVLWRTVGVKKLVPYSAVLNFYGSHICIRSGHVVVPGGPAADAGWKDLVGASPDSPGDFVVRLLAKDKGWLAAYFDALSRISQERQRYFTDSRRLRHFYEALRAPDPSAEATRGVFRPAPGLLLLVTRLQWDSSGEPRVPGNLAVWDEILHDKTDSSVVRAWAKRTRHLSSPEQLAQTMFALSRADTEEGPLQIYLALTELDSRRPPERRLSPESVRLLGRKYSEFSNQFWVFSEFPELSDSSIARFLDVAGSLNGISNKALRGNAFGILQANLGIWQILARQGQIVSEKRDESWQQVIKPLEKVRSAGQLYDAGRTSTRELLRAATGKPNCSQDEIIDLLAGPAPTTPEAKRSHQEVANKIRAVLDDQRLVSLDTLFALGDGLNEIGRGKPVGESLVPLAAELREFEMPRPIFTANEKTEWAAGIHTNHHAELQMHTDLGKVLKSSPSHAQLEEAHGQIAAFLRDTLVGLNYAYYEPPGAQALHNNPLFVRSHDFSAETVEGIKTVWQAPQLFGEGSPAGGGAHLVGSLADLPYVLAELEQDFIAPENVQALIWRELVPGLLTNAVLPRWWGVSAEELHAIALYQRAGEALMTNSAGNDELRKKVMTILSERMTPQTAEELEETLRAGHVNEMLPRIMPADEFYLAVEFRHRYPSETESAGASGQELESLSRQHPDAVNWDRLSRDFGVPHPTLAQTYARELLNVGPLPAFAGYSSRLLAESWDSNNLYWARLADEAGYSPVVLNRLVPALTRRMVEKIFATDFEDWPAILRAMRETGEEFRQGRIAMASATAATPGP
jgi:hypothetical protein